MPKSRSDHESRDGSKVYRALLIDDDRATRRALSLSLQSLDLEIVEVASAEEAYTTLAEGQFDLALLDVHMGGMTGLELFERLKQEGRELPVIFLSGEASNTEAVKTIKLGAFDFLEKPVDAEQVRASVQNCLSALKRQDLLQEARQSKRPLLGQSKAVQHLKSLIRKVASTNSKVLILGETGTGKDVIAEHIYELSSRSAHAYITVNCSAIPGNLFESELFGHVKGSFTSAVQTQVGKLELADRGTIFLDEIGDIPLDVQAKLLRFLESGEIQKVGSTTYKRVDVRILAATSRDLEAMIQQGTFRQDLFFRLNVVCVRSLPLRTMAEDIPLLFNFFVENYSRELGEPTKTIDSSVFERLARYSWPGNVRELRNVAERTVILSGKKILSSDLPPHLLTEAPENAEAPELIQGFKEFKQEAERQYIIKTVRHFAGNISKAAQFMQIDRSYLHQKIAQLKIDKKEFYR